MLKYPTQNFTRTPRVLLKRSQAETCNQLMQEFCKMNNVNIVNIVNIFTLSR